MAWAFRRRRSPTERSQVRLVPSPQFKFFEGGEALGKSRDITKALRLTGRCADLKSWGPLFDKAIMMPIDVFRCQTRTGRLLFHVKSSHFEMAFEDDLTNSKTAKVRYRWENRHASDFPPTLNRTVSWLKDPRVPDRVEYPALADYCLIVAGHRICLYPARISCPNASQVSFVFPVLDVLLFRMWMSSAYITSFVALLRERHTGETSRAINPAQLADHALRATKCVFGYLLCAILARIGTAVLNELMGTTGRTENIEWLQDEVRNMTTFSVRYFQFMRSADWIY
jgi:hypothetical protein